MRVLAVLVGIVLLFPGLCSFLSSFFLVPAIAANIGNLFDPGSLPFVLIWLGGFALAFIGIRLIAWSSRR